MGLFDNLGRLGKMVWDEITPGTARSTADRAVAASGANARNSTWRPGQISGRETGLVASGPHFAPSPPPLEEQLTQSLGISPESSGRLQGLLKQYESIQASDLSPAAKMVYSTVLQSKIGEELSSSNSPSNDPRNSPQFKMIEEIAQQREDKLMEMANQYDPENRAIINNAQISDASKRQMTAGLPQVQAKLQQRAAISADEAILNYLMSVTQPQQEQRKPAFADYLAIMGNQQAAAADPFSQLLTAPIQPQE